MDDELRKRGTSAFALSGIDAFYGDSHVLEQVSFSLTKALHCPAHGHFLEVWKRFAMMTSSPRTR